MIIYGLDPGYEQSALVVYRSNAGYIDPAVGYRSIRPNSEVLDALRADGDKHPVLVLEQIQSYGMAVGKTIFETVYWSGRFAEAWENQGGRVERLPRRDVKLHLCGQPRAKDSNIRQALIDKFGPTKEIAIGKKATPGPLYGFKSDLWAALAVAVTWHETRGPGMTTLHPTE